MITFPAIGLFFSQMCPTIGSFFSEQPIGSNYFKVAVECRSHSITWMALGTSVALMELKCDFTALASTLFAVFCITTFLNRDVGYLLKSYVVCLRFLRFCVTHVTRKE